MLRSSLFVVMACGLLSACTGQIGGPPVQPAMSKHFSDSVGFTGLGGDFNN